MRFTRQKAAFLTGVQGGFVPNRYALQVFEGGFSSVQFLSARMILQKFGSAKKIDKYLH